ncbi:MAG: hypothetical protein NXI21_11975 [Alphaproteobacteria bacterium]|nr:hypothetical protein [Alphaproteobacteria bacterium]
MRRSVWAVALALAAALAFAGPAPAEPPIRNDLPSATEFAQTEVVERGERLSALFEAEADGSDGALRRIRVARAPIGGLVGLARAEYLSEVAEGFEARARRDCHRFEAAPLSSSGREEAAMEILCDGFDPIASEDRRDDLNAYMLARFRLVGDSLIVFLYEWRSSAVSAHSVRASDLRRREIDPAVARIEAALGERLAE